DAILILELGMGVALLAGAALARHGRHRAHAWCQSTVVLVNLGVIMLTMAPSFHRSFPPSGGAGLLNSYYGLAVLHGVLGIVAELLGLYVMIVAGTDLLPMSLRFTRYRPWMRTALTLWWLTLLLGMAIYGRWYVVPLLDG